MTKDEAIKLSLVAVEEINKLSVGENAICLPAEIDTAMDACRKVLAQPEQEPVCDKDPQGCWNVRCQLGKKCKNTPPQRTLVGLTDEDVEEVERWVEFKEEGSGRIPTAKLVRYIEAKLKEKNT